MVMFAGLIGGYRELKPAALDDLLLMPGGAFMPVKDDDSQAVPKSPG